MKLQKNMCLAIIIISQNFVARVIQSWNLSKTPARLRKSSSALHVKMVGWLHDGQNSMPFPG